jgi:hypothetical protein
MLTTFACSPKHSRRNTTTVKFLSCSTYFRLLYLSVVSLLTLGHLSHGFPKDSELPNYPRYSNENRHLLQRGFKPRSPSPFSSVVEDYEDAHAAATQQRSFAENPYLYQNAIPIKQKIQQVVRPGKTGPQQFRNPEEPLREVKS